MYQLRSPVAKRCCLPRNSPLPIITKEKSGTLYRGTFNGFNVTVDKPEDMVALYTMGYFGKGSLSQGYPSYSKRLQRSNMKGTVTTNREFGTWDDSSTPKPDELSEGSERLTESLTTISKSAEFVEQLHLALEEAFFLSFAVNCLEVYHNDQLLDSRTMWTSFQEVQSNFVERYVAYHYFRAKGWVVRSGIKYGGDFILYKEGPPFFHSSYVVLVISNADGRQSKSFNSFLSYYRAIEVAKKELLICRVTHPENFNKGDLDHLKLCQVSEFLLQRWIPSENRNLKPQGKDRLTKQKKNETTASGS